MKPSDQKDEAPSLATCSQEELGTMLARVLGAHRCIVHGPVDDDVAELCAGISAAFGEIRASSDSAIVEYSVDRDRMFSILSRDAKVIGFIQVSGPRRKPQFTDIDLQLLRIMSGFVAMAIEVDCNHTQGAESIGPS
jgi:hypothetical protein